MTPITITEALAEIKTIARRVQAKRASVASFLARQDGVRDPFEKEGGSVKFIERERQGIDDLNARVVKLRLGIQRANEETSLTIRGKTKSLAEWLAWRRDVAPGERDFLDQLRQGLASVRAQAAKTGASLLAPGVIAEKPTDILVNINEKLLAEEIEAMEDTLGQLDGQLSLKNATVTIKE